MLKRITVELSEDEWRRLKYLAMLRYTTMKDLVRNLVKMYLDHESPELPGEKK